MTNTSGPEGTKVGSGVPVEHDSAEAKRLAARRRFLLGGAAALPLIVTLGQKEAWAASAAVCDSVDMSYDKRYVKRQAKNQYGSNWREYRSEWESSLYCDPDRVWS